MSCENYLPAEELSQWYLIFHHDARYGLFQYKDQANLSYHPHKFSVLSKLTDQFKIDDFFEFILAYPEIESFTRFKQKKNPMISNNNDNVECNISHFPWTDAARFECLTVNQESTSLLEGQKSIGTWFYGIGQVYRQPEDHTSIAGPNWTYHGKKLHQVDLFLRVIDRPLVKLLYSRGTLHVPLISKIKPKFLFLVFYFASSHS